MLVTDLDDDGEDEIVIGTRDGRLHSLGLDRTIRWLNAPGEEIAFLETVRHSLAEPPDIIVVRRQRMPATGSEGEAPAVSWLGLREATGERLWEIIIPQKVTALAVDARSGAAQSTILVGTQDGQVKAYDLEGILQWESPVTSMTGSIRQLTLIDESLEEEDPIFSTVVDRGIESDGLLSGTQRLTNSVMVQEILLRAAKVPGQPDSDSGRRCALSAGYDRSVVQGVSKRAGCGSLSARAQDYP